MTVASGDERFVWGRDKKGGEISVGLGEERGKVGSGIIVRLANKQCAILLRHQYHVTHYNSNQAIMLEATFFSINIHFSMTSLLETDVFFDYALKLIFVNAYI